MSINYYSTRKCCANINDFIVNINIGVISKNELLNELFITLNFPDYFGFNWDALDECLRDFEWIKEHKIIIVHEDLPKIGCVSLKQYLSVLNHAIEDWKEGEEHKLEVYFPIEVKEQVEKLLYEAKADELLI